MKISLRLPLAFLAAFLAVATWLPGCEYYDENSKGGAGTTVQGTASSDEDLKALQDQIKGLQDEIKTANDEKVAELQKKIKELEDQLAAKSEGSSGGGSVGGGSSSVTPGGLSVVMAIPSEGDKDVQAGLYGIGFKFNKMLTDDFGGAKASSLALSPAVALSAGEAVGWEGEAGASIKKDTIRFNLGAKLQNDTEYTATLSGIKAADGSTMAAPYVVHFRTEKSPAVSSVTAAASQQAIQIEFAAPMDLQSIKDKHSIAILKEDGSAGPATQVAASEGEDSQYPKKVDVSLSSWHAFPAKSKLIVWGADKSAEAAATAKSGTKMPVTSEQASCAACHK